MALEDHAGDIVAKARAALGMSAEEGAVLLGWDVRTLQRFEQTGQADAALRFERLADRLGLSADRLVAIASGWLPRPRDLNRWQELRQMTTTAGMAVNSYLIWNAATCEAALFDTGWDAEPVFEWVDRHRLELKHIFVTHAHHDHVAALAAVRQRFPKAEIHAGKVPAPTESRNRAEAGIAIGDFRVTARPTPGHTDEGTSYLIQGWPGHVPLVIVVGDALFAGSMGRVAGASFGAAKQAVRERILSLPPDTLICPGHGPVTTVGEELGHNPFFG